MNQHLTENQVVDYCRHRLGAAELLAVSDHLSACEACRNQIERSLDGDAAFFASRAAIFEAAPERSSAPAHLTSEQASDYVDGTLAGEGLQTIADHLTRCERCNAAVDDLRVFKAQIAPALAGEYGPRPSLAPTKRQWLPAFFKRSPVLAFGTAVILILAAVAGWFVWRALRQSGEKPEIVLLAPPSPEPEPPPSGPPPSVSPPLVQLIDGDGLIALDTNGDLSGVDRLPPAFRKLVKDALISRRIEPSPALKDLSRPPSSLMSGAGGQGDSFSVTAPVGKVLLTDRPAFSWSALKGATAYFVEVYDAAFNLVESSPQLTAHSWTVEHPLKRGSIYSWQVKALRDGQELVSPRPPQPQAKFRILDGTAAAEIAEARRNYPSSHLALAMLYSKSGLLDDASRELKALQALNPNSELVRKLLAEVQEMEHRP